MMKFKGLKDEKPREAAPEKNPINQVQNDMADLLIESAMDKQKIVTLEGTIGDLLVGMAELKGGQ